VTKSIIHTVYTSAGSTKYRHDYQDIQGGRRMGVM